MYIIFQFSYKCPFFIFFLHQKNCYPLDHSMIMLILFLCFLKNLYFQYEVKWIFYYKIRVFNNIIILHFLERVNNTLRLLRAAFTVGVKVSRIKKKSYSLPSSLESQISTSKKFYFVL